MSFKPDPNAFAADIFTQNWNDIKGYGFPPFSLIGRILAKIKRNEASTILIVPCWQTQPWFPQFLRMLEHSTVPVLLKAHHKLLQLPGTGQKQPLWKKLQLIVACLSSVSKWKDYRQASVISSWHHGYHLRPPQPRYSKMWDISKVLIYLKGLGKNEDLNLQQLTQYLQEEDCILYTNWKLQRWIFPM